MSARYTLREYDGTTATYTARRDIPPLWVARRTWRQWVRVRFGRWLYQDGGL